VKATVIQADAADDKAISGVCQQALSEEGRLDIFFANAGIATIRALEQVPGEVFTNTMRVNALSCYLAVKHASAAMKLTNEARGKPLSGGSIILTASIAGIRSGAGSIDSRAKRRSSRSPKHLRGNSNALISESTPSVRGSLRQA